MDSMRSEVAGQGLPGGLSQPVAGVIAGLVGGTAYLLAQVSLTGLATAQGAAEPLQRIAAILLGADAAPPPAELNITIVGIALIIHFTLAMVYGRLICAFAWRRSLGGGIAAGALTGLALFALNFYVLAPLAFPWFEESVRLVTIADHILFGAVTGAICVALRPRGR